MFLNDVNCPKDVGKSSEPWSQLLVFFESVNCKILVQLHWPRNEWASFLLNVAVQLQVVN